MAQSVLKQKDNMIKQQVSTGICTLTGKRQSQIESGQENPLSEPEV
jgi:hypothetical protein